MFKKVIEDYLRIGAITSSSKFLYNNMVCSIDFSTDIHIVELGPGNGVFTDKLLKQISMNSKISIFEIDEGFCKILKEKYKNNKRIHIYEKSADSINNIFKENSIDYIISSLPLAFIKKNQVLDILEKSKYILKEKGKFIQYQYFLQNKNQIKEVFPNINYKFTMLNVPPAFTYICYK